MNKNVYWRHSHLCGLLVIGLALQTIAMSVPPPAWAAEGTVVGTLVDTGGHPLPNVTVTVRDKDGATVATGVTDETGKFSITSDAITPGVTYTICSLAGCGTVVAVAAEAGMPTAALITIGIGTAGVTGAAIADDESTGAGEPPASLSE
jgi:hypothetical protein